MKETRLGRSQFPQDDTGKSARRFNSPGLRGLARRNRQRRSDQEGGVSAADGETCSAYQVEGAARSSPKAFARTGDWLAVVSHLNVENCYEIPQRGRQLQTISIKFDLQCDRKWEELEPTDDVFQRYCDSCDKTVHYCGTILEAREHAKARNCIAVDSGIARREDDLGMLQYVMLGMPSPESIRERRELEKPDAVSAKREELKKQKSAKKHLTDKTD